MIWLSAFFAGCFHPGVVEKMPDSKCLFDKKSFECFPVFRGKAGGAHGFAIDEQPLLLCNGTNFIFFIQKSKAHNRRGILQFGNPDFHSNLVVQEKRFFVRNGGFGKHRDNALAMRQSGDRDAHGLEQFYTRVFEPLNVNDVADMPYKIDVVGVNFFFEYEFLVHFSGLKSSSENFRFF